MKCKTAVRVTGLTCAMLALLTAPPALAAERTSPIGDVQKEVAALAAMPGVVGVIGEAYSDGRRVGHGSAGSRLIDGQGGEIPSGADFRGWSQTKAMTETVVRQLVAEGRLKLTDKLSEILPIVAAQDLVERADEITVSQLLEMTAGIPEYAGRPDVNPFDTATWYSPIDLLKVSRKYPRTGEPGEKFVYSNTSYVLLGMVIEKLTGTSLAEEFDRRLFRPLGMNDTYLPTKPSEGIKGPHGHGYFPNPDGTLRDVDQFNASTTWAAGGVISTARDMTTFFRALNQGRLLPAELRNPAEPTLCGGTVTERKGSGPGSFSTTFTSTDGRRQFAVSATTSVLSAGPFTAALERAAEAVLCPAGQ